jgi:DNA-binding transcriptional MerR regulator
MIKYTIKQAAELANVSVRTLHHYHDVGLLVPVHIGENRYRYYGEADMLRLQQIPFYREFDMKLEDIARILDAPDFDCLAVLQEYKALLNVKGARIRILLRTIDLTIDGIKGDTEMNVKDLYTGFSADRQTAYVED